VCVCVDDGRKDAPTCSGAAAVHTHVCVCVHTCVHVCVRGAAAVYMRECVLGALQREADGGG